MSFSHDKAPSPSSASSSNDEEDIPDCPICLESMTSVDSDHPLQCDQRRCKFNFCRICVESLIESSRDDFMEASDGNKHVKVYLYCPNCRSDLSSSIRDTVLLRRADEVTKLLSNDEELTESQHRMKEAMEEDDTVREAIEEARRREAEFFGIDTAMQPLQEGSNDSQDDDWGVEADLIHGVHQSFHFPEPLEIKEVERTMLIDETLLSGLGYFMTEDQQEEVTDLMCSGDPSKLAEAAEILRQVSENSHARVKKEEPLPKRGIADRRGSVYTLIIETQEMQQHKKNKHKSEEVIPLVIPSAARSRAARHHRMEMELRQEAEYLRTHPLPVRLPKCVELRVHKGRPLPLTFCNDVWDGTVLHAFCKLTIGRGNRVTKKVTTNKGVRNILDGDGPVRIDLGKPRVLVASVKGDCGRQGVMKGDVVTHLNGELFEGDASALVDAIQSYAESHQEEGASGTTVKLVLNAGRSIAEALKRRSLLE